MSSYMRLLYSRCTPPFTERSSAWAAGYANGLKDAGMISNSELQEFLRYIAKRKSIQTAK